MIPTLNQALACAVLAAAIWSVVGLATARRLGFENLLAWSLAPILGFAVHSALLLPLLTVVGLTRVNVTVAFAIPVICSAIAIWRQCNRINLSDRDFVTSACVVMGAATLAYCIAVAVMPTVTPTGVTLAGAIFDHSKIAMIDDMMRVGLPAGNPFFGQQGDPERLAYYYLWHFAAAELGIMTGAGGWAADAAMTWFTAFASLILTMGVACWLGERRAAAGWVLLMAATSSIRPVLAIVFGWGAVNAATGPSTGFGTWLFQTTWAPQHVMSASSAFAAIFVILQLANNSKVAVATALGLLGAASFETSTWVGGVVFPMIAMVTACAAAFGLPPRGRRRFIGLVACSGCVTVVFVAPFVYDQLHTSNLRADGFPIVIAPYTVFGGEIAVSLYSWLNIPAYWTVFLFSEFAAFYPAGLIAAIWLRNDPRLKTDRRTVAMVLGSAAIVSLAAAGLLKSTMAPNNDLGWRAALPAILMLMVLTAAGLGRDFRGKRTVCWAAALIPILVGFSTGLTNIRSNFGRTESRSALGFLHSTRMWEAVRRHTGPLERVANNPNFMSDMTAWPINISWALLSNRRSCYAGSDLALPFAPVSRVVRRDIEIQFARVFAGHPEPGDVAALAARYDCATIVLTPGDGAWQTDTFATSDHYRLVEEQPNVWRIYRRVSVSTN